MRITFVMPGGGHSGGNRVIALYAERLVARGHEVHVVWQKFRAPIRALPRLRARLGLTTKRSQGSLYFDEIGVTQSVAAEAGRVTAADVPDADVVVATWWETAFSVAALPASKGRRFYFVQHHEVHGHLPAHISRATYYLPLKKITISQWLVDVMAEEYGDHDVGLVENSVDTGHFDAPPRERNAVPTVGFIYSYKRFKGLGVSLEALAVARRLVPDLKVVAFGLRSPGAGRMALPEGATYFRNPPQEEIPGIYAMCDAWLCGSREEGFGLPVLEAMACRTPVVSTRVGGAVDLIEDGVNGWLAEPGDAEALGRALAEAAQLAPEAWRRMSDTVHVRARSYTWDDATDRFEALLSEPADPEAARRAG